MGCSPLNLNVRAGNIDQQRPQLYAAISDYQSRKPATAVLKSCNISTNGVNGNGVYTNGNSHDSKRKTNGLKSTVNPISVHLIDARRNRRHLVDVTRGLCDTSQTPAVAYLTVTAVDERVAATLRGLPEPELALYFDAQCCTYGLSPWQTRLTEFVRLETRGGVGSFVRALRQYAKCEQRFGK